MSVEVLWYKFENSTEDSVNGNDLYLQGAIPGSTNYWAYSVVGYGLMLNGTGFCAYGNTYDRCLFAGGDTGSKNNTIDYITISTTGNAVDFGDLIAANDSKGGVASTVRALFAGGYTTSRVKTIDYVAFATLGNAGDFGDLTQSRNTVNGNASNSIRGLWAGGYQ
ncbi:MAG: hypothetical protein WC307_05275 [Candidatus Nanoarchaeia archaeon]|jgi:hypothetical protein